MTDDNDIDLDLDTDTETVETVTDDVPETDAEDTETDNLDADDGEDDATEGKEKDIPKEVEKALRKKDRYNRNLLARLRETEAKLLQMQQPSQKQTDSSEPQEKDFDNYGDFLQAKILYQVKQEMSGNQQQQQTQALTLQQQQIRAQQDEIIGGQVETLVSENEDFKSVLQNNLQVVDSMPDHISNLVYQIDNAVIGAYALAKEGRLQDLYSMQPQIAASEMIAAVQRGNQYLAQGKQPRKPAPQPMKSLKGTGNAGAKNLANMSPDQIVNWVNS